MADRKRQPTQPRPTERKPTKLRPTVTKRDVAPRHLDGLLEISELLATFESLEQTVPEVMAVVAATVPLSSAIFLVDFEGATEMIMWWRPSESAEPRAEVLAHAEAAFGFLVGAPIARTRRHTTALELPDVAAKATETDRKGAFVTLPLVVGRARVFGILQFEAVGELDEPALIFMNTMVNQLAIALDRHVAERALRTSETKLGGIIAIAADAIISVDEGQRITMFNESAEHAFGYAKKEALGASLDMLIPERFRERHRRHFEKFAAGPVGTRQMGSETMATVGLRKNGEEFPVEATISKLVVEGGTILSVALRDITEQQRSERRQRFLADFGEVIATTLDRDRALANMAKLATHVVADVCIINVLDAGGELGRLEVASRDPDRARVCELLAQLPLDRRRPHLAGSVMDSRRPILIARVSPEHLASLAHNEEHLQALHALEPQSIVAAPLLADGEIVGSVVLVSCTASHTFDEADVELAEEMARRASLTIMNARLYREAQRATRLRDEVLGIVAHDLRNPLGSIVVAARMLRRELKDPNRVEAIERAASRMKGLIQDLLDVNHMEAGQLRLERTAISAERILYASQSAHEPLAAATSVELSIDVAPDLPDVWADGERLLQVFQNLIDNARAFTAPGGRIVLGAALRDGEVTFRVADTGSGIAPADLPHVFDRFWQARRVGDRARGPGGLGLPIVKGIVESHGGRIWVESTPGEGSTFYFTIPTAPADP